MAMVTARRGQHTVKVSKRSYETLFRNKGYRIVEDEKDMDVEQTVDYGEPEEQEVETVPISEMNKEQLAEYAKEHNIDTSGARNVREARQIIQKAIREAKM
nr:MAG TPA: HeH/LEM domain [Caudoviricetes sp.]